MAVTCGWHLGSIEYKKLRGAYLWKDQSVFKGLPEPMVTSGPLVGTSIPMSASNPFWNRLHCWPSQHCEFCGVQVGTEAAAHVCLIIQLILCGGNRIPFLYFLQNSSYRFWPYFRCPPPPPLHHISPWSAVSPSIFTWKPFHMWKSLKLFSVRYPPSFFSPFSFEYLIYRVSEL